MRKMSDTQKFSDYPELERKNLEDKPQTMAEDILKQVYSALREKGYNPVNQIVGYILSGDPTYITSHKNARVLVSKIERDELLEELVTFYLDEKVL